MLFEHIISNAKISLLKSDSGQGGISGQAYRVADGRKEYKLRKCADEAQAKAIESLIVQVPEGIFPYFHGRDQNCLLFDYIPGRDMTEDEPPETLFQLGRNLARINAIPASCEKDPAEHFAERMGYMTSNNLIDGEFASNIQRAYDRLRPKIKIESCLDYSDVIRSNIRISNGQQVIIVDEESLKERFRG